jgi:hypothetical protein
MPVYYRAGLVIGFGDVHIALCSIAWVSEENAAQEGRPL